MQDFISENQSCQGQKLTKEKSDTDLNKRDAELIRRICNADEQAFEQLYHHYYSRLFRFIVRVIRKTDLVDEVINDVMFVIWNKADSFNNQCKPSTWIFGIAYNKARQSLRGIENTPDSQEQQVLSDQIQEPHDTHLERIETLNLLESAFDALSPDQRTVIELTYFHGLHYHEIAQLMSCPENTVKTRMYHARKKLAVILKKMDDFNES